MKQASILDSPNLATLIDCIPADLLHSYLDNPYESLIIVDSEGIIRFFSSINETLYGLQKGEAVGKHIHEINPDSKLPEVLITGKAEIGRIMTLKGKQRIVARIPIFREGEIIGAVGKLLFHHPEKIKQLHEKIDHLKSKLDYYKNQYHQTLGSRYRFDMIIGNSEPIRKIKVLATQAAMTDSSVIITGESGTGKELFAHAIHHAGHRCDQNFVKVNCASIPNELIEAELFGYEPGTFTGGDRNGKSGKFEMAHRGTIFLDEIGDMPLNMQVKLLRTLQEKEIERLGGRKPKEVDFRLICATNRDLEKLIRNGKFRLDLFYRINVVTIQLPPLREMREDIPLFFEAFVSELSRDMKIAGKTVSNKAMALLQSYNWPGNMRELRNVAERAMIVAKTDQIEIEDLPSNLHDSPTILPESVTPTTRLKSTLENAEKQAIITALERYNSKAQAAKALGIHRTGLYQKMKKYRIQV